MATMRATFSHSTWAGRKDEDRTVAVQRHWPRGSVSPSAAQSRCCGTSSGLPSYTLLAIFDGHNGARAARFAADHLVEVVETFLPPWQPGSGGAADEAATDVAAGVQQTLALAFLELHRQFATEGRKGGCTATVALQVGRLVTVANVGSSRCCLVAGQDEVLLLSRDHKISSSVRERQRLLAAGCQVAQMDLLTRGPARSAAHGDGVLRVWPGGLALSRSIGDFSFGQAILPLPHIKQVVLPPAGGRVVLASDSVWSTAGEQVLQLVGSLPPKLGAIKIVKAVSTSRSSEADASCIVLSVLPGSTHSFTSLCCQHEQQQQSTAAKPGNVFDGSKAALRSMFSRSGSSHARQTKSTSRASARATVQLLADVDTAELLGLAAWGSSEAGTPSRCSSVGSAAWKEMVTAAKAEQTPAWLDDQVEFFMRSLLSEASLLWHKVRCHERATQAAAALSAAALEEQGRMGRLPAGHSPVEPSWLADAAAVACRRGAAGKPHWQAGKQAAARKSAAGRSQQHAPALTRSTSLPATVECGAGGDTPSPSSLPCMRNSLTLPAGGPRASALVAPSVPGSALNSSETSDDASEESTSTVGASSSSTLGRSGAAVRRVSFEDSVVEVQVDPLATPRRHLAPLRTSRSCGDAPAALAALLQPPAGGWQAAEATGGSRPLAMRSTLATSSSGSLTRRSSCASSACPIPALSPRPSVEERALRRRAPGELAASPGTKWNRAYAQVAGVFTKSGSGYSSRNLKPAAGMDTWAEAYSSVAGQFMRCKSNK